MLPGKEELLARYAKKESVADAFGRIITVVRLKMSESVSIRRLAETEDTVALAYMWAAAAVRAVDDTPYPFPRTMQEVSATIDALDEEGLSAAFKGLAKLDGREIPQDPKSSPEAPASASSAS